MQAKTKLTVLVIVLLLLSVGLVYLSFFSEQTNKTIANGTENSGIKDFSFENYVKLASDTLNPKLKSQIDSLTEIKTNTEQNNILIANLYKKASLNLIAANYFYKASEILNDERSWFNTGFEYYNFASSVNDSGAQAYAIKRAIEAFEKTITVNSKNVDAKNALALCYVQNDLDVMKGVQLSKEVLVIDSNNIQANFTLGMLSMRSGQWDKALIRFKRICELNPLNSEAYYYLGETYKNLNMNKEAIVAFETCMNLATTPESKQDIKNIINTLKQKK